MHQGFWGCALPTPTVAQHQSSEAGVRSPGMAETPSPPPGTEVILNAPIVLYPGEAWRWVGGLGVVNSSLLISLCLRQNPLWWLEGAGAGADPSLPKLPLPWGLPGPGTVIPGDTLVLWGPPGRPAGAAPPRPGGPQDHTSLQGWSSSAGSTPRARRWPSQTCLRDPA